MSKPGYPIWWEDTITIYNKFEDAQTNVVSWFKTVIDDCFWQLTGTEVNIGDTALNGKSIVCRIPKDDRYKDKSEWIKIPNDQMKNYFTLGQGDIIVKGNCDFVINEYQEGQRSTDLLAQYQEYQQCFSISQYSDNTGLGRNNEHYLARGK